MNSFKLFMQKHAYTIVFIVSILITIQLAVITGIVFVFQDGSKFLNIKNLEDIKPEIMTTLFDDENNPIKEYAHKKRKIASSDEIPAYFKKGFITAEDKEFKSHWGINFKGTFRAILGAFILKKNLGGGSSITQQLARELFLEKNPTIKRKFQEMLLAIQLERKYSKDQILTFYLNMLFLGYKVYGVKAASGFYFGKSVSELSLAESVLLCIIPRNPNRLYDIFKNPKNCIKRRNQVLGEMLALKKINKIQYEHAIKEKLPEQPHDGVDEEELYGGYFFEDVRRKIKNTYGDERLYGGGLKIYSTLNLNMQKWATNSLKEGLRELDKRQGWRKKKTRNIIEEKGKIEEYELKSWDKLEELTENQIVKGIVQSVSSNKADIKIKDQIGSIDKNGYKWTRVSNLRRLIKKGDIVLVKIAEIKEIKEIKRIKLILEQEPEVQGAIIVMDNKTGEVKAMSGGYSFSFGTNEFNRATQALRQPGSTMKPIVYTAAIENGYTPATIIQDEPYDYYDETIDKLWQVNNDQGNYKGPITLRRGLQQSRNTVSARIVEQLTPQKIVEYGKRFGIASELKATHSIALGTYEVTLMEMTSAYTVFPNMGVRVVPYMMRSVRDRNNNVLDEKHSDRRRVIDEPSAYIINYLMQGVVKYGSGVKARPLLEFAPIGGKTGTTQDYSDAWFIGFCPDVTVGVWVGHDIKKTIGNKESGQRAASPIFVKFLEKYLEAYPQEVKEFSMPAGIIKIPIDRYTGKRYGPHCLHYFLEAFREGTEPDINDKCTEEDHLKITDYFDNVKVDESNRNTTGAEI